MKKQKKKQRQQNLSKAVVQYKVELRKCVKCGHKAEYKIYDKRPITCVVCYNKWVMSNVGQMVPLNDPQLKPLKVMEEILNDKETA